ncbi:AMP-binding protein [Aminivibrio sp.]|uniref:AMP-binding protein n=1 Tax=Aminivibrio sp. TaxID=1872489 RepID=UPI001A420D77|nr:AMP-binding protein [Aminivibrio sp.]MBL3540585.1 AMP-binding protein [Aminivibrio sp.]
MVRLEKVILDNLRLEPEKPCLWWEGTWWSNGDLLRLVEQSVKVLEEGKFRAGYRLAVLLPNSPLVLALSLAAWSLGGAISPLNEKSGIPSLMGTLQLAEPCAVVLAPGLDELRTALEERDVPVVVAESLADALPSFAVKETSLEDDSLAVIFATSGTTGMPKAVPLTHGNLLDNILMMYDAFELLQEGDILLNVLPNFHSFGFTVGGLLPLVKKLRQALVASFLPPSETMKTIHDSGTNVIVVVPTMLYFMTAAAAKGAPLPVSLKLIVTGGDRLNVQLDEKVKDAFGVGILEGYGLTECSPVVAVNRNYKDRRLGTVGPLLRGYEWKLLNDKNEDVTSSGEGVLWVKGPSVASGYFRDPVMTAERFADGWFNTGDYVRMEDGYVRILDRVTDIIIVGGFNVYPQEVEAILLSHPAVSQAAVVGIPHPVNGEVPKAFIRLREGTRVTQREIIDFCKKHLAHFKVPRSVEFMESFPLSSTGKVLRRMLRQK